MFFWLLKRVFELDFVLLVLRDFSASAVFCFTSSISTKCFPFRAFLHLGKQTKKKLLAAREGRAWRSCHSWSKTAEHLAQGTGRRACKSRIMKWANGHWKSLQKKFTEREHSPSQHQLVHWYRRDPRTLTEWGGLYYKGSTLLKIILVFFGGGGLPIYVQYFMSLTLFLMKVKLSW